MSACSYAIAQDSQLDRGRGVRSGRSWPARLCCTTTGEGDDAERRGPRRARGGRNARRSGSTGSRRSLSSAWGRRSATETPYARQPRPKKKTKNLPLFAACLPARRIPCPHRSPRCRGLAGGSPQRKRKIQGEGQDIDVGDGRLGRTIEKKRTCRHHDSCGENALSERASSQNPVETMLIHVSPPRAGF